MLQKRYRLDRKSRFTTAHVSSTPFFLLRVAKNELSYDRFGIVVSKKVDHRATARNRVRRVLSSSIEQLRPVMQPGYDLLFIMKKNATSATRNNVYQAVEQALKKEKIIT